MTAEAQKVAIVSGAGRGIGRAIAVELARAGFALCLAARTREELEITRGLTALEPRRSLIVLVDLADDDAPASLLDATVGHYGRLDLLVNNAGWAPPRTALVKMSPFDHDRVLAVNLRAPIALTRLAAIRMIGQSEGGAIVNIASSAARTAPAGEAAYAAAKAGLVAFTRAAFAELRQHGIRLSVIIPGLADTTLIPANKRLDRSLMLTPSDVAAAVLGIVNSPANVCPLELVLEPRHDPLKGAGR